MFFKKTIKPRIFNFSLNVKYQHSDVTEWFCQDKVVVPKLISLQCSSAVEQIQLTSYNNGI